MNLFKEKLHVLIDSLPENEFLEVYYQIINNLNIIDSGKKNLISLSDFQKEELELSYNESLVQKDLIDHNDLKATVSQWF
ncbi:MAG: hypothetical protein U0V04_14060 [Spirosomataceae bacterium]|jgi:hypothetical protein